MSISVFEIFKIGIGPSSSHTVGPMRVARTFLLELTEIGFLRETARVESDSVQLTVDRIRANGRIRLLGEHEIDFKEKTDLVFHPELNLPAHANGLRLTARADRELLSCDYYETRPR